MSKLGKVAKKIMKSPLNPLGGAVGIAAKLMDDGKKKKSAADMDPNRKVQVMPDLEEVQRNKRRSLLMSAANRGGRDSTIMTDKLG
jgi:hypothetical protein